MSLNGNLRISTKVENKVFVDATYGDDVTGERENPSKPYKTILKAVTEALSDDIVIINGDHVITSTIILPLPNTFYVLEFLEGSSLTGDFLGALISTSNGTQNYEIHGRGVFRNPYTLSPSNAQARVFSTNGGGTFEIFGAKSISCFSGRTVSDNDWLNIKNVDEIYSEGYFHFITGFNSQRDGITYGFVENCKFGNPAGTRGTYAQTFSNDQIVVFNNCEFTGGSGSGVALGLIGGANNSEFYFNNCRIIATNIGGRAVWNIVGENKSYFTDCVIYSESSNGLQITSSSYVRVTDCKIKAGAFGVVRLGSAVVEFDGVNRIEAGASTSVTSTIEFPSRVNGTLKANKPYQSPDTQVWNFLDVDLNPVLGDIYTVTANDGTEITYTVIAADTSLEVYNGLVAASVVKGSESINDFTHFTFNLVGVSPWSMVAVANESDYNYDLNGGETFAFTCSGADVVNIGAPTSTGGFATLGGDVLVDENLTL